MRLRDALLLLRDGAAILGGKDYFHAPQPLGLHWTDDRCYYNDLRRKADWDGPQRDGIPLLSVPGLEDELEFPIMVLQFGLGSLDRHFSGGVPRHLAQVDAVHRWLTNRLSVADNLENPFARLDPGHRYASANSAMAQGQVLSLAHRLAAHLPQRYDPKLLTDLTRRVHANLLESVERGGTMVERAHGMAFVETTRDGGHLVYNGWIFAVFGLFDEARYAPSPGARSAFEKAEESLAAALPSMVLADGWSTYDEGGTIASPFYHRLHLALVDAMHRLTGRSIYADLCAAMRRGERPQVRGRRIVEKAVSKLRDGRLYTGSRQSSSGRSSDG